MADRFNLDSLLRLNEEIAALVKARAPIVSELSEGAARLNATQLKGDGSAVVERLRTSLESGATLDEALRRESDHVPAFYAALVRAGAASGRLPSALEAFGVAYRRLVELRRVMRLSLVYPVAVALVAWLLLVFAATVMLPTYDWIGIGDRLPINLLRAFGAPFFLALAPVVIVIVSALALSAWRSKQGPLGLGIGVLGSLPGCRGVARLSAHAAYAGTLGLLVRNNVPLPAALRLTTEATGWPRLHKPSADLAERIEQGSTLQEASGVLRRLPPLVRAGLLVAESPAPIADALDAAAGDYDHRARAAADRLAIGFPAAATAIVGGVTVGAYALLMLQPYVASLVEITTWFH